MLQVKVTPEGIVTGNIVKSKKIKCERLFADTEASNLHKAICKAIDGAEKEAKKVEKQLGAKELSKQQAKAACNKIVPFNAEGAVAVTGPNGRKVWVGLRAPLLPKNPDNPLETNMAILLRMTDLDRFKFDQVALLDLGERGIRELALDGNQVWGIAGPPEDRNAPFELWRFPMKDLKSGVSIKPNHVRTLEPSSEGLAFTNEKAYVVIDGSALKKDGITKCEVPARYQVFDKRTSLFK